MAKEHTQYPTMLTDKELAGKGVVKAIVMSHDKMEMLEHLKIEEVEFVCGVKTQINEPVAGACGKRLKLFEAYRCVGCDIYFHKNCMREHIKLTKASVQ